jgi:uncharacterized membrane protein SpoIIM required for sporulation
MGIKTFNREEILGREIDELNLRRSWRLLRTFALQPPAGANAVPADPGGTSRGQRLFRWLRRVYLQDLPYLIRHNWLALAVVAIFLLAAGAIGWAYVDEFPLPQGLVNLQDLSMADFESVSNVGFLPSLTTGSIFLHNVRALLLAALLAVISLGVTSVLMLMIPILAIGFLAGQVAWLGYSPLAFVGAFVLPHGLFEIPAALVATAFALRIGASITAPREGMTVGEGMLSAIADFGKVFVFLVVPLLLLAAAIEAHVTPAIVVWVFGG